MTYRYARQNQYKRHAKKLAKVDDGLKENNHVPRVVPVDKYLSLLPIHQKETQFFIVFPPHAISHEDAERMALLGWKALMEET